jgi:hypothetical protein
VQVNDDGRGNRCDLTRPDWIITGDLSLKLRAEVHSNTARVYTIKVMCKDASGNRSVQTVDVMVKKPETHLQKKRLGSARSRPKRKRG